jgi:hypothetical protein
MQEGRDEDVEKLAQGHFGFKVTDEALYEDKLLTPWE